MTTYRYPSRGFSLAWAQFLSLTLLATVASAQDWPQWRGPDRTGVTTWSAPDVWPDALKTQWKITVGEGHASPAVVGDVVYQFARLNDRELVRALRLSNGETIWESSYAAPYQMNPAAIPHGPGPKSSPLVTGGKVYTLGIHGIVSCHNTSTGEQVWQTNTNASPEFGHSMSPLLVDGKLIVHTGDASGGTLSALEPQTGRPLWEYKGYGPGYASPILVEGGGSGQIVTQTQRHIVGLSVDTGELLWQLPFTTPHEQNVITPIIYKDTLILAGLGARTFAISIAGNDPKELWSNPLSFYMSTPVLVTDALVGFSDKKSGHFVVINAATGETTWTGPPRQGDNAALVAAGASLLTLTDGAELAVRSTNGSELETLRTYSVAESPTWAHPVPTTAGILIKDKMTLTLWSVP
jgi:outer membrane protein assembly factor BamB